MSILDASPQRKWLEYERRKREWVEKHGYKDAKAYDAFIKVLTKQLGI